MASRHTRGSNGNGEGNQQTGEQLLHGIFTLIQQNQEQAQAAAAQAELRAQQAEHAHQQQMQMMQEQIRLAQQATHEAQAALQQQQHDFLAAQQQAQAQQMADIVSQIPVVPPRPPPGIKQFRDLRSATFAGTETPLESAEFLRSTRDNLRAAEIPERAWVDIVKLQLTDIARRWWESAETRQFHPISWETFEEEFDNKFFPPIAKQELEDKFSNLEQGDNTVDAYDAEFSRYQVYAPRLVAEEKDRVRHFRRGLRPDIRTHLSWGIFLTHAAILGAAREYEREQPARVRPQAPAAPPRHPPRYTLSPVRQNSFKKTGESSQQRNGMWCSACKMTNHWTRDCRMKAGACHQCGGFGHIAKFCPKKGPSSQQGASSSRGRPMPTQEQAFRGRQMFTLTPVAAAATGLVITGMV